MAEGAARTSNADIGLSTTGIAGPGGGTPGKPVGTVYVGLYVKGKETKTLALKLPGERNQIRERAAMQALNFLRNNLYVYDENVILSGIINPRIFAYVKKNILPLYDAFDDAHNREHAEKVVRNSLSIARDYDVDINKVYVIAAYHDVGLTRGREEHEKHSAAYLLADEALAEWFSRDDLILMAEAIEDHRASSHNEPRSLYGKIISEADRDIEYEVILKRCVQYGISQYPGYTEERHFDRVYAHMQDKYGENGYMKLWLNSEPNAGNLKHIRNILASREISKKDFTRVYNQLKTNSGA
jgi:uncharacterized protein